SAWTASPWRCSQITASTPINGRHRRAARSRCERSVSAANRPPPSSRGKVHATRSARQALSRHSGGFGGCQHSRAHGRAAPPLARATAQLRRTLAGGRRRRGADFPSARLLAPGADLRARRGWRPRGATGTRLLSRWGARRRETGHTRRSQPGARRSLAQGYLIDRATLEHDLRHYLGPEADRADPRVSPLRASGVMNLPPTVIHTAESDPLRDEGAAYAERLRAAGVKITYRCHPGMIHLFYGLGALIPYAGAAFRLMGADVRSLMAKPAKALIPAGRELEDERAPPG